MSFKRLELDDFIISNDSITSTLWSNNVPSLTTFFTNSIQEASSAGTYYLAVYNTSSTDQETQFDIVYCDALGSGSSLYNNAVPGKSPSTTLYGQFRTLILEDENSNFIFGASAASGIDACGNTITSSTAIISDHFWMLSLERARYKQSIFPGSLNLSISGSTGTLQLTDNSNDITNIPYINATKAYQLVSGSNGSGISVNGGYTPNSGSYGIMFPDLGLIMLNPLAVSHSIGLVPSRSNDSDGFNNQKLFNALKGAASFGLNSQETISSDYVFVRARNSEFNYSENPSFISGSTGEVIYSQFINAPQTYITTVGMYNDMNELVAVAKMSRPLLKDFTKEALIRVKLDF
tara:strand:+ start:20275 stop:21321 length:1047 start_codon:yes stop_codon:yes gene_type:complete